MNVIDKFIQRIDAVQRRTRFVRFGVAVIKKYGEDEAGYQAALMAYYGFLSLFPLLLVLTTVVRVFLGDDTGLRSKIISGATNYFPLVGNDLQRSVHGLADSGLALVIGILVTIYGARGIADVFRNTINHFWEVPRVKRPGFPWSMLRSLRIILVGGLGLILAPILSGYTSAVGRGPIFWLLSSLISLLLLFGVFIFLIQTSLPRHQPFHLVWPSSFAAAIGLGILQSIGSFALTHELKHLDTLYGTFALVLFLFFWLYLQAQVTVWALEAGSVRVLGLYPRSLVDGELTRADSKAYRLYANRNHIHRSTTSPNDENLEEEKI